MRCSGDVPASTSHDDFDLSFLNEGHRTYRVHVSSPGGEAEGLFTPPEMGGVAPAPSAPPATRDATATREVGAPAPAEPDPTREGAALFDALFTGAVRDCFTLSLDGSTRTGRGLRIRVRLTATPELVGLPWETLYSTAQKRHFALSISTPIVRFLDLPQAHQPLRVDQLPLRMCVVLAQPEDLAPIDAEAEWSRLQEALSGLVEGGVLLVTRAPTGTHAGLLSLLAREPFHLLHFIGHGDFDAQTQEGRLAFTGADGRADMLSGARLGALLQQHQSLRLAVLNACKGAASSSGDAFSGTAQSLAGAGIPAVIAMLRPIGDEAATVFARELYGALAVGWPVDAALSEARRALFRSREDGSWTNPVLYTRAGDCRLFELPGAALPASLRWNTGVEARCPFPGLESFDEDRTDFFFGREAEIAEARALLGGPSPHRRWLQIDGPSGTGKSSFARAGLLPALRRDGIASGPKELTVVVLRPGADPLLSLARALHAALPGLREAKGSDEVERALRDRERPGALRSLLADHAPPTTDRVDPTPKATRGTEPAPTKTGVLMLIDQLEEAFTLAGSDRGSVDQLDALLDAALADTEGSLYLVTTIRSDFTGRIADMPRLAKRLATTAGRYYLRAMERDAIRRALIEPARLAGLVWAQDLPDRILDDAAVSPATLPLVAHVLFALWSARVGRTLSATVYSRLGGVGGALAKTADDIVNALGDGGIERARAVLVRLVKTGHGSEDTRQSAPRAEALAAAGGGEEAERILARLSGGRDPEKPPSAEGAVPRLVVVSHEAAGDRVDLVHEALIQKWGTLKRWIAEERSFLELRDDIEDAARVWRANGASEDSLPAGGMLERFLKARRHEGLSVLAREFLDRAREVEETAKEEKRKAKEEKNAQLERERAQEKRLYDATVKEAKQQRTLNIVLGVSGVVLIVALAAVWIQNNRVTAAFRLASENETKAKKAAAEEQARRFATAAELAHQQGNQARRILLSIEAWRRTVGTLATSRAAEQALYDATENLPDLLVPLAKQGLLLAAKASPDGEHVLTVSTDGAVRLWTLGSSKEPAVWRKAECAAASNAVVIRVSEDGKRFLTYGSSWPTCVWPVGGEPRELPAHAHADRAALSPDGTRVVTASGRELRSGSTDGSGETAVLAGHSGDITSIGFSGDGRRFVTGSKDGTALVWPKDGVGSPKVLRSRGFEVRYASLSPDGERAAVLSSDGTVRLWSADGTGTPLVLPGKAHTRSKPGFSPDGRWLQLISESGTAEIRSADGSGDPIPIAGFLGFQPSTPFSPDGRYAIVGANDRAVRIWSLRAPKEFVVLPSGDDVNADVTVSRDGGRVIAISSERVARRWEMRRLTSRWLSERPSRIVYTRTWVSPFFEQ